MKKIVLFLLLLIGSFSFAQEMKFTGVVNDTINDRPLEYAVVMAVCLSDGKLLGFTRTAADGSFDLKGVPIDTMELVVSHYKFDEKRYYIIGSDENNEIHIPNIILPEKATELEEVVVYANKEPIYFRGDTLVYVADSFATKENASVEDLLKNLPGIQVDENGNVSSQGRRVTKVLVDGDEFFGSDPTIATRNLNAKGVDKVEIYETEDDNSGGNTEEKIQVLDVRLKDDAKSGYFGKVAGRGGFNTERIENKPGGETFYEGEFLANYFDKGLKLSVFGLGSNTPNTGFNYRDASRFGLTNEMQGGWRSFMNPSTVNGLPENYKGGFYFSNKFSDKFKMGLNYTYNDSRVTIDQTRDSEYFFGDTTSYVKKDTIFNTQKQQSHTVNLELEYNFDSKTSLKLKSNVTMRNESDERTETNRYFLADTLLFNSSEIHNVAEGKGLESNIELDFKKEFAKRNRVLDAMYQFGYTKTDRDNTLNSITQGLYAPDSIFDQKRNMNNHTTGHRFLVNYMEPLSNSFRLKLQYRLDYFYGQQETSTYDRTPTGYDDYADLYSNDISNNRLENRGAVGIVFSNRKNTLEVGARVRNVNIDNFNNHTNSNINQNVTNVLPYLEYNLKFSNSHRVWMSYSTSSNQPSLNQLQPVRDNVDPNSIVEGNPDLVPDYSHSVNVNYNKWNAINYSFIYAGAYFTHTDNAFSNAIEFQPNGQSISRAVNVDGNMYGGFYGGGGVPLYKKVMHFRPNFSGNYTNFRSFINNQENRTENYGVDGTLAFEYRTDSIEVSISAGLGYNYPKSTLSMGINDPYTVQRYKASVFFELPWQFFIDSDVAYEINSRRAMGYNEKPFIWNVKLSKRFLKTGNLIIDVAVNDIFNQNIGISRNVGTNIISDVRTRVIARYFMFGATWRFNNNKTKEDAGRGHFF